MHLIFVAPETINLEILLDDGRLVDEYMENGPGIEVAFVENFDHLKSLLKFLFKTEVSLTSLVSKGGKTIFDFTPYKQNCISIEELEKGYLDWIKTSGVKNTMDEYGNLVGVIGYIKRNKDKRNLILITEEGVSAT